MPVRDENFIRHYARPGDIVSVRSEDWIGRSIRWVTESNVNHTALYIGNGLIIESDRGKGVQIIPLSVYLNDPTKEVYLSRVKAHFDANALIELAYKFYGEKYDLLGQFGILIKYLVKKVGLSHVITFFGKNRANNYGIWCSEYIGILFWQQGIRFSDTDTSYLTPGEIFESDTLEQLN
jgi:hypothetical protein